MRRAGVDEITAVPGIGPATAEAVVAALRRQRGGTGGRRRRPARSVTRPTRGHRPRQGTIPDTVDRARRTRRSGHRIRDGYAGGAETGRTPIDATPGRWRGDHGPPPGRPAGIEVAIVSGLSGAGRSTAAKCLEDLGWFVVDNLPPELIATMVDLGARARGGVTRIAVVLDVRSRAFTEDLRR